MSGIVVAVSASPVHDFSKSSRASIRLVAGFGVEGDAHMGATVRHRWLAKRDPTQPNRTQVHIIHAELLEELNAQGFHLAAGEMGENVTTQGVDLLNLPVGARLHLGKAAVVEVTGLRDPCAQLNGLRPGLMKAVMARDAQGRLIRKVGIMSIVLAEGEVLPGDGIRVELPPEPWLEMGPV